jgi:hypothetical protein
VVGTSVYAVRGVERWLTSLSLPHGLHAILREEILAPPANANSCVTKLGGLPDGQRWEITGLPSFLKDART